MGTNPPEEQRPHDEVATDTATAEYMFRPSLMGAPQEFAVEREGLAWRIGRHSGHLPYRSIRRIRLSYRPVTLQMHRFLIEIWSDEAPKFTIASSSWRTLVEQERLDRPYRTFVLALHKRLLECGAHPVLRAGSPPLAYWPGVVIFVAMALAFPLMLMRTGTGAAFWGTALVVAVVGFFLWQLGNFFWRNRPVTYSADAVPEMVLPRG